MTLSEAARLAVLRHLMRYLEREPESGLAYQVARRSLQTLRLPIEVNDAPYRWPVPEWMLWPHAVAREPEKN